MVPRCFDCRSQVKLEIPVGTSFTRIAHCWCHESAATFSNICSWVVWDWFGSWLLKDWYRSILIDPEANYWEAKYIYVMYLSIMKSKIWFGCPNPCLVCVGMSPSWFPIQTCFLFRLLETQIWGHFWLSIVHFCKNLLFCSDCYGVDSMVGNAPPIGKQPTQSPHIVEANQRRMLHKQRKQTSLYPDLPYTTNTGQSSHNMWYIQCIEVSHYVHDQIQL